MLGSTRLAAAKDIALSGLISPEHTGRDRSPKRRRETEAVTKSALSPPHSLCVKKGR